MSLNDIVLTIFQNNPVSIILKLKDGRFTIYSEKTRIIQVHNINYSLSYNIINIKSKINCMIQTFDEKIICASYEITVIKLNKKDYEIIQNLNIWTNKIIELTDNNLIAIQNNNYYIYSFLLNKNYILKEELKLEENINNLIKVKDNEFCFILDNYFKELYISIFDIKSKQIIKNIFKIKCKESGEMCLLENKYLVVSLYLILLLIDINEYKVIHKISTSFGCVVTFCYLNNYTFLSGDEIGDIIEWKIANNKIIKVKEYNNGKKTVKSIIKFNKNLIAVGSNDCYINFYDIDD